jgi:hypothetical protein
MTGQPTEEKEGLKGTARSQACVPRTTYNSCDVDIDRGRCSADVVHLRCNQYM